jgi:hypothetical protein
VDVDATLLKLGITHKILMQWNITADTIDQHLI